MTRYLGVGTQIPSAVWISTSTLDSFQESATVVSINRKAHHSHLSRSGLPLGRLWAHPLGGGGKGRPELAPVQKVSSYQKACPRPEGF